MIDEARGNEARRKPSYEKRLISKSSSRGVLCREYVFNSPDEKTQDLCDIEAQETSRKSDSIAILLFLPYSSLTQPQISQEPHQKHQRLSINLCRVRSIITAQ